MAVLPYFTYEVQTCPDFGYDCHSQRRDKEESKSESEIYVRRSCVGELESARILTGQQWLSTNSRGAAMQVRLADNDYTPCREGGEHRNGEVDDLWIRLGRTRDTVVERLLLI